MLQKKYDSKSNALVKTYDFNPFNVREYSFLMFFKNNYAAILNNLTVSEPQRVSPIPTIKLWIKDNGLEFLNHGIIKYHFGWLKRKPRIKGFYETKKGFFLRFL